MKQVANTPRTGVITVVDVPAPSLPSGGLLVRTAFSVISVGTEMSKVELAEKNLLAKARARPDLAAKAIKRARTEGIVPAIRVVRDRLAGLDPLGYSAAGVVLEVAPGVAGFAVGDRVACGGASAGHAEVIAVPRNLAAKVPDDVGLDSAAFATVGAIALHGIRQAETTVGETVGVVGLGLIGQLAVRILRTAGAQVVGIDPDPAARELAQSEAAVFDPGSSVLEAAAREATRDRGLDAVLVCAAAADAGPIELAAKLARDRAKIVVVGALPVAIDRALMYDKELDLRIARSYGPGRYDVDYEEYGRDLPPGYVRWTEQRNLEAFLALLASGRLSVVDLITHRYPIAAAPEAYAALRGKGDGRRPFGVVLEYESASNTTEAASPASRPNKAEPRRSSGSGVRVGLIGAGGFARATLLPALSDGKATLVSVADSSGLAARDVATRFGFERAASSPAELIEDETLDAVAITTRHSSHAALVAEALRHGKAVFVEKPLALDEEELALVRAAASPESILMVGFNRRFAPLVKPLVSALEGVEDRVVSVRVNAGPLPADHWVHDPEEGGGRLLGEGCHFVDLLTHIAGAPVKSAHAVAFPQSGRPLQCTDSIVATLQFASGAVGALVYAGTGDPHLPKERIEVFGGGVSAVLDDFRRLELYRGGKRHVVKKAQDKGHRAEIACFLDAVAGRVEPPSLESYFASTRVTLALLDSLRTGEPVRLI
jgi:predicted dehydrogenase